MESFVRHLQTKKAGLQVTAAEGADTAELAHSRAQPTQAWQREGFEPWYLSVRQIISLLL